jgi:uncharacterized membrane protein
MAGADIYVFGTTFHGSIEDLSIYKMYVCVVCKHFRVLIGIFLTYVSPQRRLPDEDFSSEDGFARL